MNDTEEKSTRPNVNAIRHAAATGVTLTPRDVPDLCDWIIHLERRSPEPTEDDRDEKGRCIECGCAASAGCGTCEARAAGRASTRSHDEARGLRKAAGKLANAADALRFSPNEPPNCCFIGSVKWQNLRFYQKQVREALAALGKDETDG